MLLPPQPFNVNAVLAALSPGPADLDSFGLQPAHKVSKRELTALIGVEDLWPTAINKAVSRDSRQNSVSKAFGELSAEHTPGMESMITNR